MPTAKAYADIPGTYILDGAHTRRGYRLNMFCMSLIDPENRARFKLDEASYLDSYHLSAEQKSAVLERRWLDLLRLGGNIYYTFKLATVDRLSMQHVGGCMSGMAENEFKQMMLAGGRSIEGNRYTWEWEKKRHG